MFDDGTGPALHAGGLFQASGAKPLALIARWNGREWSEVGGGLRGGDDWGRQVRALVVHDDGTGPALYCGGLFDQAGEVFACNIARWDGRSWHPLGQGVKGVGQGFHDGVSGLGVYDDGRGNGPALYAGGHFVVGDGEGLFSPARWDGSAWAPVLEDLVGNVMSFAVYDDGLGDRPALYLGGSFSSHEAGILRFDGTAVSTLGEGLDGPAAALRVFDDGSGDGPALFVGGDFDRAGGITSLALSKWVACPGFVPGDLDGEGLVGDADLAILLRGWGPCPDPPAACPADLDGNGAVGTSDLVLLLSKWDLAANRVYPWAGGDRAWESRSIVPSPAWRSR